MHRRFILDNLKAQDDAYLPPGVGRPTDIVILVMGPTGVGKSTFINNALGEALAPVSDGFKSCTTQVAHYFVDPPENLAEEFQIVDRRIILVDTPSFDNTEYSDLEVLRQIAVWLASAYDSNMSIGGVLYLYPIYPRAMSRIDRSNVKVFQKICGTQALSKVILTTTRWNMCPPETGEKRRKALAETFWSDTLSASAPLAGRGVAPLWDSRNSALDLIKLVLQRRADSDLDGVILTIQHQIVDEHKKLRNTDAAQEMRRQLEELLKESDTAISQTHREKLRALAGELKLPLSSRIMSFFGAS